MRLYTNRVAIVFIAVCEKKRLRFRIYVRFLLQKCHCNKSNANIYSFRENAILSKRKMPNCWFHLLHVWYSLIIAKEFYIFFLSMWHVFSQVVVNNWLLWLLKHLLWVPWQAFLQCYQLIVIDFPLFNGRKMPEMRNYVQHTRGYFSIFLATRFYVKTILGTGEVNKLLILYF